MLEEDIDDMAEGGGAGVGGLRGDNGELPVGDRNCHRGKRSGKMIV